MISTGCGQHDSFLLIESIAGPFLSEVSRSLDTDRPLHSHMRNLIFSDGELKFKLFIQDELVRSPVDPSGVARSSSLPPGSPVSGKDGCSDGKAS